MTLATKDSGTPVFVDEWRRRKSAAFDLMGNSTARGVVKFDLWGKPVTAYANANFSIYSAERCNAACRFCVEELRPASRGISLQVQKRSETDDMRYFERLEESLEAVRALAPTLSITGGEPSKDGRLPRILEMVARTLAKRKTLTTNGSGLLDRRGGRRVIDEVVNSRLSHLNISIAATDPAENAELMRLRGGLTARELKTVVEVVGESKTRVRLSCVLLRSSVKCLEDVIGYLEFARSVGVSNVIFRQLMKSDPATYASNSVVAYSQEQRVELEPLLDEISGHPEFGFVKQIVGYYYYVEVWRFGEMDVVFEEADLAQLEAVKRGQPGVVHELIFHPNGRLASTWQPWDGVLGPPDR